MFQQDGPSRCTGTVISEVFESLANFLFLLISLSSRHSPTGSIEMNFHECRIESEKKKHHAYIMTVEFDRTVGIVWYMVWGFRSLSISL